MQEYLLFGVLKLQVHSHKLRPSGHHGDSFPGTVTGISLHCQEGYTVRLAANRGVRRQEGYPFLRAGTPGRWRERFLNWGIESFVYELLEGGDLA